MASLEDLIPTVNKLQDVMYDAGIDTLDLPVLAVIGSQSSGKSSILETLVGKDFLPRGTGIVTRRPLVLQLNNISPNSPLINEYQDIHGQNYDTSDTKGELTLEDHLRKSQGFEPTTKDEWGEFLHLPGRRFYDFGEIRQEIENETARIAGKNKGISRIPINLKVFSPRVLNLTLVDLPGITKVPIGEQPADIEKQIKNLILEHVAKPNCIILAISPANVDLVNSESLKLARDVDPHGKRTIGVITKMDLMDSGTNALDILSGKLYPLKLGFVGIVNRSQQDIQANRSVEEALNNEEIFFTRHPVYRTISTKCGTRYLAKLLNHILMNHIRDKLPDIKARLNTLMGQTEQELATYGGSGIITKENRAGLVLQLMNKFAARFVSSIEGTSSDISTKELCGGARIYYIYNNIFGHSLESINPTSNLSTADIRTAIRNSTGPRPSLFVPELAFDLLVKPQIYLLLEPSQRCVEMVYEELMKICHNCGSPELARYPKLQAKLIEVVSELLRERLGPTRSYVESLIDIHRAYINTNHPNFLSATDAMSDIAEAKKNKQKATPGKSDLENAKISLVKELSRKDAELQFSNATGKEIPESSTPSEASSEEEERIPSKESKDSFLNYFFGKDQQKSGHFTKFPENGQFPGSHSFDQAENAPPSSDFEKLQINGSTTERTFDEPKLTEREELECELIRRLIISYFGIVREMIQDQIPKAVMCLLVNFSKEIIQNRLVTKLYKESLFEELLLEDQNLAQDREKCVKLLDTYKEASKIIGDIL
ncbi:dynamin-related GTPase DNM1 [Lachancea thermotolerans CBS 6340]|uniref:dynamin GTPase n=1 Tax=Lachancea thermotolerans (strain ATCC 56472 / CBS 6340 / NRRL Y-8284) TaxID=559295 RepID=C5DCH2_LACTC|nr:KLTH0B03058p [Lachancea thermotolerans CBS 6340]CAR21483.1 KLTH0B03058p [Lachancea thermotolerans CBS 6340]